MMKLGNKELQTMGNIEVWLQRELIAEGSYFTSMIKRRLCPMHYLACLLLLRRKFYESSRTKF